jgi:hypothetical protein
VPTAKNSAAASAIVVFVIMFSSPTVPEPPLRPPGRSLSAAFRKARVGNLERYDFCAPGTDRRSPFLKPSPALPGRNYPCPMPDRSSDSHRKSNQSDERSGITAPQNGARRKAAGKSKDDLWDEDIPRAKYIMEGQFGRRRTPPQAG